MINLTDQMKAVQIHKGPKRFKAMQKGSFGLPFLVLDIRALNSITFVNEN